MRHRSHLHDRHLEGGFTVMEALLTLGLVCLTMAILGSLIASYSRVLSRQGNAQKSLLGCQVAVDIVRRDVGSAIAFSCPSADTLHVEQIDRLVSSRLPKPLPDPLPASWSPHKMGDRVKIDFRIVNGSFLRKVTLSGGATFEDNVTEDVDGVEFRIQSNGNLKVTASALVVGITLKSWTAEVSNHLPEELYP